MRPSSNRFTGTGPRLRFLESIARLWQQLVAGAPCAGLDPDKARSWTEHARTVQEELLGLLDASGNTDPHAVSPVRLGIEFESSFKPSTNCFNW
ncbi:MAG: hypothetical protein Ct9H300mP1_09290 [Planctomycetaceae bacterium]|nr:MAG: hypothetical protein Ct9H300mP1_09290 [Planctomycetaceae bacterium]